MPSPLAHGAVGWWLSRSAPFEANAGATTGQRLGAVAVFAALSVLPDVDFLPGLLLGDTGGFHNGPSHSLLVGVLVALLLGPLLGVSVGRWLGGSSWRWCLAVLASYWAHLLLDTLTAGRGVKLLWPWWHDRLAPPFAPFYGVRWSEQLLGPKLAWTLVNELAFVGLVVALVALLARRGDGI